MRDKYRLYRRSNRAQCTFYAQNSDTGARESLGKKTRRGKKAPPSQEQRSLPANSEP